MATRIKSSQIEDGAIVAADLHSAIAINTTQSGTFGSVIVDNITVDGSSITNSTGHLVINSDNGDMHLDVDGQIKLEKNGVLYGNLFNSSNDFGIHVAQADKSLVVSGSDNGTPVNALVLDMSNGGRATFAENVSVAGDLTVTGNLQVDGTQTVLNTATLSVEDLNITVASGASTNAQADGAGLTVDGASATILYDGTNDLWQFNKNIKTDVGVTIATAAPSFVLQNATGTYNHKFRLNGSNSLIIERYDGTSTLSTLKLDETGDVGFYEDNSGSPQVGMHWDYADGRLGIGTDAPSSNLEVAGGDLAVSAGHIGIGLSSPSPYGAGVPTLHFQGTSSANTRAGAIYFTENNGDQTGAIYSTDGSDGYGGIILHSAQGDMKFSTGALQDYRMVIDTSGNVGIGTDSPVGTLDVKSTNSVGSVFRKDFNGPVADTFSKVAVTLWGQDHDDADVGTGTDQFGPMLGFGARIDDGNPNSGDIRAGISYSYNGDLTFHAKAGSSVADGSYERIRIDGATGNVGIGAKVPSENLDIQSGDVDDHVHVVIGPSATHSTDKESHLQLWRTDSNSSRTKVGELMTDISLPAEGTRGTSLWSYQTLRLVTANSGAGHIVFAPKGTIRMRIDDAGNVGVGSVFTTTAPPDKQFHVKGAGDIKIEDNAGGSAHLHITSSTNGLKNSEWRLKTSGSNDEFYIDHMYTANDGTSDVAVTNGQSFKITGDTHNIYNTNSQVDIRPTLNLDFTNSKSLDSRFTFLRASTATYTDSHGVIRYASHNEPRYDWDPLTGECLGLLFEEETVNHCSAHLPGSGWGQFSSHLESYSGQTLAPDGTMSGVLLVEQSTEQQLMFANVGTVATGSKWTWSIYVKAGHANSDGIYMTSYGESVNATFNPSNGTSSGHSSKVMTDVGNGWYRCQLTFTKTNTSGVFYIGFTSSTRAPDYQNRHYIWGAQVENKDFATTYIRNLEKFTSRASNATYHDSTGRLVTAFRDQPRYSHRWNGAEWIPTGLLRETGSTHLDGGDNTTLSNWGKTNCTLSGTTATTAPDGSYTAQKYVETGSGSIIHRLAGPVFQTTGQNTVSVYLKDDGSDTNVFINASATLGISMLAKPSAGTILDTFEGTGTVGWFGVEYAGDGWWRYYMGAEGINGSNRVYIGSVDDDHASAGDDYYVADGTSGFYVWGYQRENHLMPTSFIYSRWAGSTTRSGDVVNYEPYYRQNDNLDMYNAKDLIGQVQGTVFTEWATKEPSTGYGGVFELQDEILGYTGIPSNGIDQRTNAFYMTGNYAVSYTKPATNTFTKTAFAYDGTSVLDSRAAKDGVLASTNTVHSWNMRLTRISIGRIDINNAYILNGHIKKFRLYTDRLSDDTLKALTEND